MSKGLLCQHGTKQLLPIPPSRTGEDWRNRPEDKILPDRCPVILCKAIDHLHRERNVVGRELGEESREGVKKVVEELSKLRLAV